jgi:hypothetical protein
MLGWMINVIQARLQDELSMERHEKVELRARLEAVDARAEKIRAGDQKRMNAMIVMIISRKNRTVAHKPPMTSPTSTSPVPKTSFMSSNKDVMQWELSKMRRDDLKVMEVCGLDD